MRTILTVLSAMTLVAILAVTVAYAHHPGPPEVPQRELRGAYLNLHDKAERNRRVHAGRNVVTHGRAKDGRFSWSLTRREFRRLYRGFNRGVEAEHVRRARAAQRARQAAAANRAPAWFISLFAGVRTCESGNNPSAYNPAGYGGLYQFDQGTWNSVGGSGWPGSASVDEQHYRAYLLYRQRGTQPWPHCGRYAG